MRTAQLHDLERCLREVPDSVFCRLGKADFLLLFGQLDPAHALLEEARRIDPRSLEVLIALLELANARGESAEAARLVEALDRVGRRLE